MQLVAWPNSTAATATRYWPARSRLLVENRTMSEASGDTVIGSQSSGVSARR
jgi:hypothetical protein